MSAAEDVANRLTGSVQLRIVKLDNVAIWRIQRWVYYGWLLRVLTGKSGRWKWEDWGDIDEWEDKYDANVVLVKLEKFYK